MAGLGAGGDGVAGVGGDALGAVDRGDVPQLHVLGDVVGGQAQVPPGVQVHDVEGTGVPASGVRLGDRPPVTVLDEVGGGSAQFAVVAAGDDRVTGGGGRPVGQPDLALLAPPVTQSFQGRPGLILFEG